MGPWLARLRGETVPARLDDRDDWCACDPRAPGHGPAMPAHVVGRRDPDDLRVRRRVGLGIEADRRHPVGVLREVRRGNHVARRAVEQFGRTTQQADVEILVGVAERQHHVGATAQVADLLRVRLREDEDGLTVPPEPDRHEMRPSVGPDHGQPHDRLLLEEPADPGRGERRGVHVHTMAAAAAPGHRPPSRA
jgi:hypothetical protein